MLDASVLTLLLQQLVRWVSVVVPSEQSLILFGHLLNKKKALKFEFDKESDLN